MEKLIQILIYIHIGLGTSSIVFGPLAAISKKGGKWHKLFGKIFAYSLIATALLALLISVLPGHQNLFLFSIGIFGLYLVASGLRMLKLKKLSQGQRPAAFDWALSGLMGIFSLAMITYGSYLLLLGGNTSIIRLVFGGIAGLFVYGDIKLYVKGPQHPRFWLLGHISKMNGSLITAFTALLVNNSGLLPGILSWLLPTFIGSILGMYWGRKYRKKNPKAMLPAS